MVTQVGPHDADVAVGPIGHLEFDHDLQNHRAVGSLGRMP
jgi:hypothetical protein